MFSSTVCKKVFSTKEPTLFTSWVLGVDTLPLLTLGVLGGPWLWNLFFNLDLEPQT